MGSRILKLKKASQTPLIEGDCNIIGEQNKKIVRKKQGNSSEFVPFRVSILGDGTSRKWELHEIITSQKVFEVFEIVSINGLTLSKNNDYHIEVYYENKESKVIFRLLLEQGTPTPSINDNIEILALYQLDND